MGVIQSVQRGIKFSRNICNIAKLCMDAINVLRINAHHHRFSPKAEG